MARAVLDVSPGQAEMAAQLGHLDEAERAYRRLLEQTHEIAQRYDEWATQAADVYRRLARFLEAGYLYLYLQEFALAKDCFARAGRGDLQARVAETQKSWDEAAEAYQAAQLLAHAAVARERAHDYTRAAELWRRLLDEPGIRRATYERALVHLNYGLAVSRSGQSVHATRALIEAQRQLEQVADEFATRGERERAFDCYQVLVYLGRETGQFENLAEGYLNSIRVLREDGLKFYALQYYEDFVRLAEERKEHEAAATLWQEVAEYTQRCGLPYHRYYLTKAAEAWETCGHALLREAAPVELAENAFLAAIGCFSAVGAYHSGVGRLFRHLASLDLGEAKRFRYSQLVSRYEGASDEVADAPSFPDYLKQSAYADIWFVDVLEWELAGKPEAVAGSVVGLRRYPDSIRRAALSVALESCAQAGVEAEKDEAKARVAALLGELQSYAALRPLEVLFAEGSTATRRAVLLALRFLFFKRSFVIVRQGLADAHTEVQDAAILAMKSLTFPHAFNPLAQIYRDASDPRIKTAALQTIGAIKSLEAGEFLIQTLRQEQGAVRDAAAQALAQLDNPEAFSLIRQCYEMESDADVKRLLGRMIGRH